MLSRCTGLENSKTAKIGGSVIWPDPMYKNMSWTELGLPALLTLSAMYTMKFWLRLKQPVSCFRSEVVFTIPKKDRYIFKCSNKDKRKCTR